MSLKQKTVGKLVRLQSLKPFQPLECPFDVQQVWPRLWPWVAVNLLASQPGAALQASVRGVSWELGGIEWPGRPRLLRSACRDNSWATSAPAADGGSRGISEDLEYLCRTTQASSDATSDVRRRRPPVAAAAPRCAIGRKKPHWLLADSPSAAEVDDPLAALRRWLAGLSDSQVSLLAVSDFDSEFRRDLWSSAAEPPAGRQPRWPSEPARPASVRFVSQLESAASGSESDEDETELDAVSSVSDTEAAPRMPRSSLFKVSDCLPVDEASKTRALSTLRAVTGAGDPEDVGGVASVLRLRLAANAGRLREAAQRRLRAEPPRAPRPGRRHPDEHPGGPAGFRVRQRGCLAELDRRLPSLAKTRHDAS
uniref:Uncharacterized protein n=1 Tax=Macrostomum lignano TaxID=282301 RepID=A0A1I8F4B0_9PLAT